MIRKHNFSVAIFAPGWVYETLNDKTDFRQNQDKWDQHNNLTDLNSLKWLQYNNLEW